MKKIVGILAAAAVAASAFAVDFSAGVRLEGSLFNYKDNTVSLFKEAHVNEFYHVPISFSISDDRAGGQLKLSNVKDLNVGKTYELKDGALEGKDITLGNVVIADAWSIWFKPVDILKITVGRWSTNLNQEHIDWSNTDSGIETDGYALSLSTSGFSWDIFLASGNNNWFVTANTNGGTPTIAEFYTKVQYAADFGTVNAFFNAANSFKDFRFGAGFNFGSTLPVGLWINAIGTYAGNDFQRIRAEADVSTSFGSIGWELFVAGGYDMKAGTQNYNDTFHGVEGWHLGGTYYRADPAAFLGFLTKFSIPADALNFYVVLKDSDVLAKDFSMTVKPGFTTNVGCCAIECAVDLTLAQKFAIDVPVNFKVNF